MAGVDAGFLERGAEKAVKKALESLVLGSAWTCDDFSMWIARRGVTVGELDYLDVSCVNPASLDLKLSDEVRLPAWYWRPGLRRLAFWLHERNPDRWPLWGPVKHFRSVVLQPGDAVLGSSIETVHIPNDAVGYLFCKSTMGRLLLEFAHAGYVDPGFNGELTFELWNQGPWPIRLTAGMRLVQLSMIWTTGETSSPYAGKYQNQRGPTPARQK